MAVDKNLVQRTLAGIVFLAVMIFCIWFNTLTVLFLFTALSVIASWELVQMVSHKTASLRYRYVTTGLLAIMAGLLAYTLRNPQPVYMQVLYFLPLAGLSVLFLLPNTIERRVVQPGIFVFAIFYTVIPFVLLQALAHNTYNGYNYFDLLFLFILVWTNDTMAYVCGRLFGKHKLAPEISPKKTWEGFVGGIVFCIVAAGIVFYTRDQLDSGHILIIVAMGLMVGVSATVGDLFESVIKRWAGVKDSGNVIPGHGGILDRFDGAIFAVWPYFFLVTLA